MLPRCDESAIVRLGEVHTFVPLEAEYLEHKIIKRKNGKQK
jgi:hypothetical protein